MKKKEIVKTKTEVIVNTKPVVSHFRPKKEPYIKDPNEIDDATRDLIESYERSPDDAF